MLELVSIYGLVIFFIVSAIVVVIILLIKRKQKENIKNGIQESNTCGIISFITGILSILMGGIFGFILAIVSLICGITHFKNPFGIIGTILSVIYLIYMILVVVGIFSFSEQLLDLNYGISNQ